ncbi:hypothetical protein [Desulfocurvibacter africanus]|uniref:hypothetical protein n=1 Tax=Desulfocurvibacter africanus TaxID=873 RepID=UPI00110C6551|nr:hypothetical protein [Desulfocurvibacter africanus]
MAHSNRRLIHWTLVIVEVLLFVAATACAYLSQKNEWPWFIAISIFAIALFTITKVFATLPGARDLLARDDMASKMALSAEKYGVCEYFNMQDSEDQELRNKKTQHDIENASILWLCANSGASFLDPSIYRHWSFIENKLNNGVEFRVVLLDPYSNEKRFRNQINVAGELLDSKLNLANIIKLQNKFSSLEIRFVQNGMNATVFATNEFLYFDPYHVGVIEDRIENRCFSLRIKPSNPEKGVGLYRLFRSHFETLWRASITFEEWIAKSKNYLPPNLPILKSR